MVYMDAYQYLHYQYLIEIITAVICTHHYIFLVDLFLTYTYSSSKQLMFYFKNHISSYFSNLSSGRFTCYQNPFTNSYLC